MIKLYETRLVTSFNVILAGVAITLAWFTIGVVTGWLIWG